MDQKTCSCCGNSKNLTEFYFYKTGKRAGSPLAGCKTCKNAHNRTWHKQHPGYNTRRLHERGLVRPMSEATDSPVYLGVHIAERVLSGTFENITKMPYGFSGYDFICKNGFKIDVKSSCLTHNKNSKNRAPNWKFMIWNNQIADYFLCIAFDDRDNLDPKHVWLIPGDALKNKTSLSISDCETSIIKWNRYEQPLNKVITCCDKMR